MRTSLLRRRATRAGVTAGLVAGLVLAQSGVAFANIDQVNGAAASTTSTTPTGPLAGDITIHSTGTVSATGCPTPAPVTRIRVYQGAFAGTGATGLPAAGPIFQQVFNTTGAVQAVWSSAGFNRGTYTLTDPLTGTLKFGTTCIPFTDSQTATSNPRHFITLDNTSAMTLTGSGTLGGNTTIVANLFDLNTGRGINGQTVNITFNGGAPQPITTANVGGVDGIAQIVSPTTLARGDYPLSASFAETLAWRAASAVATVHVAGGTQTTYTGATSAFWNDTFIPKAAVVAIGDPTPVDDSPATPELVTFTFGSQSETAKVINGVATGGPLDASNNPGTYQISATYAGDPFLVASTGLANVVIKQRPTALTITGPTTAHYGENVTLAGKLTDVNTGAPIAGMPVHFSFGTVSGDGTTNASGIATTTVPAQDNVGSYTLTANYAGDVHYITSQASKPFQILFPYTFVDSLNNGGSVELSPATNQLRVVGGGVDSGIRKGATMFGIYLPTDVVVPAPPTVVLPTFPGDVSILHLPFLDKLPLPTVSNAPVFGSTVGEVIASLTAAKSLSVCDILIDSTCALRFVVVSYQDASNKAIIGVFDLKTLLFVAATNIGTPRVLASTGSCLTDVPGCLSLSALPSAQPNAASAARVPNRVA